MMGEPIPQPHGGAITPRYGTGKPASGIPARGGPASGIPAGGPAAGRTSFTSVRREVRELYAGSAVEQARRLLELCDSEDERVRTIAIKEFNDRYWGKVGEVVLCREAETGVLDLSHLSAEERERLNDALELVYRDNGGEGETE